MKKSFTLICLLLIGFTNFAQNSSTNALNIANFEQKLKEKAATAQLIDVRTPDEYSRGHLKKAININYNDDNFEDILLSKIDKKRPVFVYCFSGKRSTEATAFLKDLGYKEVYNMAEGFAKWTAASKPYISENKTTEPIAAFTFENLDKIIQANDIVLIDFYTEWCGPCKKMNPIINKVIDEQKHVKLLKLDAEKNDHIAVAFKVEEIPTFVVIKKGKQVWRGTGEMTESELQTVLKKVSSSK